MKTNRHRSNRRGLALLLVLIVVSFAAVIALLFLLSAQQERVGTNSYAQGSRVRELAATAVNLVMGQISTATKQGTAAAPISWASQPGMIRTYDATGALHNAFKLYSWNNLVEGATFNPNDTTSELPPATWAAQPALYTDLNQPLNNVYPIVDPAAATQVEDFSIDSTNVAVTGSSGNPAPMPVQWLYVLQDGTWVVPAANGTNSVTVAGATASNPIVGRIAFWTDDETSKVNVNTASEGAYWDWPKAASSDELQFAGNPPVKNEFNRIPGHPATTSLSAVFPEMRAGTFDRWASVSTYAQQLQDLFTLTPRIAWGLGGSQGGTFPVTSLTASYAPAFSSWVSYGTYSPITLDADRLYPTADEAFFKPNHTAANPFSTYSITSQQVAQRLFFLSANSAAPETTLFETPRVSLWLSRDPLPNAEIRIGPNLYEYVGNNPIWAIDPLGLWTGAVGVSVNFQIGPVNINFSGGVAVDGYGNVGTYYVGGGGLGVGAKASGGVNFSGSNACTISDLSGPFANFNLGGGLGPDVESNVYTGSSPHGQVTGGGVTIGVGAGGGGSGGGTYTVVNQVGKL